MRDKQRRTLALALAVSGSLFVGWSPASALTRPACDIYKDITSSIELGRFNSAQSTLIDLQRFCPTFNGFLVDNRLVTSDELRDILANLKGGSLKASDVASRLALRAPESCRLVCGDASYPTAEIGLPLFPVGSSG